MESSSSLVPIPTGSNLIIRCYFSGVPAPTRVEWTKDGIPITVGVVTDGTVSTLTVENLQPRAVYQCHVENIYGTDLSSVFLCPENEGTCLYVYVNSVSVSFPVICVHVFVHGQVC